MTECLLSDDAHLVAGDSAFADDQIEASIAGVCKVTGAFHPVDLVHVQGDLTVAEVSGGARLHSYTVNHQRWFPGQEVPYVIGLVELVEQPGLRLTTNIVNCPIDRIAIGMPLRVLFEIVNDDVALPLFEPAEQA